MIVDKATGILLILFLMFVLRLGTKFIFCKEDGFDITRPNVYTLIGGSIYGIYYLLRSLIF